MHHLWAGSSSESLALAGPDFAVCLVLCSFGETERVCVECECVSESRRRGKEPVGGRNRRLSSCIQLLPAPSSVLCPVRHKGRSWGTSSRRSLSLFYFGEALLLFFFDSLLVVLRPAGWKMWKPGHRHAGRRVQPLERPIEPPLAQLSAWTLGSTSHDAACPAKCPFIASPRCFLFFTQPSSLLFLPPLPRYVVLSCQCSCFPSICFWFHTASAGG